MRIRSIVACVGRIAPGLRCGVVTAYGPTGAWRVLAEADLARSVERLATEALPRLVAAHEDVLTLDERSWALPLVPADGRVRGCIVLLSDHARVLPPDSIARLIGLARTAAESLEEARRAQVIALAERQEAALRGLPRLMLAAAGRDEVLEIFGSTIAYALPGAEWRVVNTFETVLHGLGRGDHGAAAAIDTLRRERDRGLDPTIVDCLFSTLRDATATPAASDAPTARSA